MKYVWLAIGLLTCLGCATRQPDLRQMPSYSVVAANIEWKKISEQEAEYQKYLTVLGMLKGLEIEYTEKQIAETDKQMDLYLYHHAAATVFLFWGDYESMDASIGKADDALTGIENVIVEAIEGKKI